MHFVALINERNKWSKRVKKDQDSIGRNQISTGALEKGNMGF